MPPLTEVKAHLPRPLPRPRAGAPDDATVQDRATAAAWGENTVHTGTGWYSELGLVIQTATPQMLLESYLKKSPAVFLLSRYHKHKKSPDKNCIYYFIY